MIFASYEFIFLFLPIVVITYFLIGKKFSLRTQHLFLVAASFYFYGYFNPKYLIIIIASILVNYTFAIFIQKDKRSKLIFTLGVLFNVGMLGYYKYYDFFIENLNFVFKTDFTLKYILLPLGISFFTFQQLSFLLSVYKKEEKVENIIDYSLFVTFFPQLVAGPIVLYSEMIPQFKVVERRYINYDNFSKGIYIFVLGLYKKIVIADTLAQYVNYGFDTSTELGFIAAWVTALSYTLQIYFDFSGYSDMAIGLGKMLNIDLPRNFNSPYKSASIGEFWRRWHITLGRALSAYIYIPLGGSRKGLTRTCINLMIVFFVSGIWHGAAWTFIVWGTLHGLLSVFERLCSGFLAKVPNAIKIFGTFMFVNFTWVLFRATSWHDAIKVYKGMFGLDFRFDLELINLNNLMDPSQLLIIIILLFVVFWGMNAYEEMLLFKTSKKYLGITSILFIISVIHLTRVSQFIYFNF